MLVTLQWGSSEVKPPLQVLLSETIATARECPFQQQRAYEILDWYVEMS